MSLSLDFFLLNGAIEVLGKSLFFCQDVTGYFRSLVSTPMGWETCNRNWLKVWFINLLDLMLKKFRKEVYETEYNQWDCSFIVLPFIYFLI